MTFDIARTSNPARRLGSAIGVINGRRVPRHGDRRHGDRAGPGGVQPHRIDRLLARRSFKWAFATQYLLWAVGIVQTLRYRRRTIRELVERDPDAYAALRRGVHLSPPT